MVKIDAYKIEHQHKNRHLFEIDNKKGVKFN